MDPGEAPSIEKMELGSQGVILQGKDREKGELHKERISAQSLGAVIS